LAAGGVSSSGASSANGGRVSSPSLVGEDRLSEGFRDQLLSWRHSGGFSVYGRHLILNEEPARLAHMARYAVRAPAALDRVTATDDGRVLLEIPRDPRSGATTLVIDPLEWVRRITNQVPAPRAHMVRYYGAYANRAQAVPLGGRGGLCSGGRSGAGLGRPGQLGPTASPGLTVQ